MYSLRIYEDLSIEIFIKNVLELNWEDNVFCSGKLPKIKISISDSHWWRRIISNHIKVNVLKYLVATLATWKHRENKRKNIGIAISSLLSNTYITFGILLMMTIIAQGQEKKLSSM